jgi:hypothetical protein
LFLRSAGSTTYELLLATPDTEPVKTICGSIN